MTRIKAPVGSVEQVSPGVGRLTIPTVVGATGPTGPTGQTGPAGETGASGALPAWWVVDGATGAESVEFDGSVVVAPSGVSRTPLAIAGGDRPDASELAAGQMSFWFEATAGAPLLHVQVRDANGDVFTATVPLTRVDLVTYGGDQLTYGGEPVTYAGG
jgi:hypothetical protein